MKYQILQAGAHRNLTKAEEANIKDFGAALVEVPIEDVDKEDDGVLRDEELKKVELNSKAIHVLHNAMCMEEYARVKGCKSAKEIWDLLETAHVGSSQVKTTRVRFLTREYQTFEMYHGESIKDMHQRFNTIINNLDSLGKTFSLEELNGRIIEAVNPEFGQKVCAINKAKDIKTLSTQELIGSLKAEEEVIAKNKARELRDKKKMALVAAKAQKVIEKIESDEDDEDMDILANGLKTTLSTVIGEQQTAYVPGKNITDDILLMQEMVCGYHKRSGRPRCPLKIDIMKAYDKVKWSFLWTIMRVILHGHFKRSRGLKQGDPLSPYLFVIVMEIFTKLLKSQKDFHYHPNCEEIDLVNVSFSDDLFLFHYHPNCEEIDLVNVSFSDDLFLLSGANVESMRLVKKVLAYFGNLSGLHPILRKSCSYFVGVSDQQASELSGILGISISKLPVRYFAIALTTKQLGTSDYKGCPVDFLSAQSISFLYIKSMQFVPEISGIIRWPKGMANTSDVQMFKIGFLQLL
ncbi:hypothetical protein LIER_33931 [Lithospermum erythrorhizon]|uniref:Reverse transcriptase domain-containing protein n=1 Tax=Lithospermum erythrorhizon TaxID=34254 RepID=A0AAV3RY19_LITER